MAATDITNDIHLELAKKLYEEEQYEEVLRIFKGKIDAKKEECDAIGFTDAEASFLWGCVEDQYFKVKNYKNVAAFCRSLFEDLDYQEKHPEQLIQAGLFVAYHGDETQKALFGLGLQFFRTAAGYIGTPSAYAAMKHMGYMYEKGHGVDVNLGEAYKLYELSAEGGDPDGCYCWGLCHYNNKDNEGKTPEGNLKEAAKYWEQAANSGKLSYMKLDSPILMDCWTRLRDISKARSAEYMALAAVEDEFVQSYQSKLDHINSLQMGQAANMSEQKAEMPDPIKSEPVVGEQQQSNPVEEPQKTEGAQSEPKNSSSQKRSSKADELGTVGMFKKGNTGKTQGPPSKTGADEEGFIPAGRGRARPGARGGRG